MPNPQFSKPWHGVPRASIHWNPTVLEEACIGCGTCVTGCSRLVYRFDFERKKPVVTDPLNCMVGCTTCANTCPAHAITFPPIETVLALESKSEVRHAVEDDLLARQNALAAAAAVPHPDRIVTLEVIAHEELTGDVLRLTLKPVVPGECFCEFMPGQYIELWRPDSAFMSRAYSIANMDQGDGRIVVHLRRVEGGRFTSWAFEQCKTGDRLLARGPLGHFTMRSRPDVPLTFVAGGTGVAPVLALIRQQAVLQPDRTMTLVWGGKTADAFYCTDELAVLRERARALRIIFAVEDGKGPPTGDLHAAVSRGTVLDVLSAERSALPDGCDVYAAGPPGMLRGLGEWLDRAGIAREHVHFDSFGV
jgi:CDP-4-dehydro-6-deoxyglucose reductase